MLDRSATMLALWLVSTAAPAAPLEKLLMPGPLTQAHAKLEDNCQECHAPGGGSEAARCLACHEDVGRDVRDHRGFHGRSKAAAQQCRQCHSEHKGREADIVGLAPALFDHAATDFALAGAHRLLQCVDCHARGKPHREAAGTCIGCHEKADVHRGQMGKQCQDCHSAESWRKSAFDHDKTDFPLKDRHRDVACGSCHADRKYEGTPTACASCHKLQDRHGGLFGDRCGDCHDARRWTTATRFDHDRATDFPLQGRHRSTGCHACHTEATRGKPLKTECHACHAGSDFHQGRFGRDCASCHSTENWKKKGFNHEKDAGFALRGAHGKVGCDSCHAAARPKGAAARVCVDCHRADDPHRGRQGDRCESCHQESSWTQRLRFDHDLTRFPLVGAHAMATCAECHLDQAYAATVAECGACHRSGDVHKGALGPACDACHNPAGWAFWTFDHAKQTKFALTGKHAEAACADCHRAPAGTAAEVALDTRCQSCHASDDAHRGGFGTACGQCHTTGSFGDVRVRQPGTGRGAEGQ